MPTPLRHRPTPRSLLATLGALALGLLLIAAVLVGVGGLPGPRPGPPPTATPTNSTAVAPLRLISRGVPVRVSSGQDTAAYLVDGQWRTWEAWRPVTPTPAAPQWLALDLGAGPQTILLEWNAGNNTNYDETRYGGLGSYVVETSADSTDGADGSWLRVADVPTNTVRTRTHLLPFAGRRWVRLTITALPPAADTVALDEVAVYDASAGLAESWVFLGDSITALAFDRAPARSPSFADLIHQAAPGSDPVVIDAGVSGETSLAGLARLDTVLARHPEFHYWVLAYGTNDVTSDPAAVHASEYAARMGAMAARIRAAGHVPVLAPIPFSRDPNRAVIPQYNAALATLAAAQNVALGPDLYAYFAAHPDELSADGVHPSDAGSRAIARLWADWRLRFRGQGSGIQTAAPIVPGP